VFKTKSFCLLEFKKLTGAGQRNFHNFHNRPELVRRNSSAPTLKEVLSATEDIKLYLFMPASFLAYASDLIRQAFVEHGLISEDEKGQRSCIVCWLAVLTKNKAARTVILSWCAGELMRHSLAADRPPH
jgi:hypothetical protein